MSIALVVTRGYGNGTLTGSIADVVRRGYTAGAEATPAYDPGENAVYFDGTGDNYLDTGGADLDGNADSQVISGSLWVKFDADANGSTQEIIYQSKDSTISIRRKADGAFAVRGQGDEPLTEILNLESSAGAILGGQWYHVMFSADIDFVAGDMWIDGVSDLAVSSVDNINDIDYTVSGHRVGIRHDDAVPMAGCLSEVWLNFAEWVDLLEADERAKFYLDGAPVALGLNGETPTTNSPIVYLNAPAATFHENAGTGGDFTQVGTLTDCATTPGGEEEPFRQLEHGGFFVNIGTLGMRGT